MIRNVKIEIEVIDGVICTCKTLGSTVVGGGGVEGTNGVGGCFEGTVREERHCRHR